jgi:uroporphyrinogen-III synthase
MGMRILVTRPALQAQDWVATLQAQQLCAYALPLIAIAPLSDTAPVRAHWQQLQRMQLVVFVSPNAVTEFFALKAPHQTWPAMTRAASSGPGTTLALLHCGVPTSSIIEPEPGSAQFDSETLWQVLGLHAWQGTQVLLVRGGDGRDWLANQLLAQGATVQILVAYQRSLPVLSAAQELLLADALAAPSRYVWFFSSSEAINHLATLAPLAQWNQATAIATHPRIAQRANSLGMGSVHCVQPTLSAVVSCIQSLNL